MGRKTRAAPGTAHSSTGISTSRPRTRSGAWAATWSETLAPSETPADDGLVDPEIVEQGHHVVGVGVDAVGRGVAGLVGPPVPGEVEEDDPVAGGHQVRGQPAVHLAVEEDPVHEHEDVRPAAVVLVVEVEPLDLERTRR